MLYLFWLYVPLLLMPLIIKQILPQKAVNIASLSEFPAGSPCYQWAEASSTDPATSQCLQYLPLQLRSPEQKGTTKRLYAAKFDIDMAKCMYCGLCTVVCPTECITMTDSYDRSFTQLTELTYRFSDMTPDEAAEKRTELEKQLAEKEAAKQAMLNQSKSLE